MGNKKWLPPDATNFSNHVRPCTPYMYANIKCHICYQHYLRHPYEDELAVIEAESFSD